jgi:hypothetical protein
MEVQYVPEARAQAESLLRAIEVQMTIEQNSQHTLVDAMKVLSSKQTGDRLYDQLRKQTESASRSARIAMLLTFITAAAAWYAALKPSSSPPEPMPTAPTAQTNPNAYP